MIDTPATKAQPSALDGYERAKPDEPIFVLQGGDPLAIDMTKEYINRRRTAALEIEDDRKRTAELLRCTEAERTLWAMQEYHAGTERFEAEPEDKLATPEAIDLFDYRVRAAQSVSNMGSELNEIGVELERRGFFASEKFDEECPSLSVLIDRTVDVLRFIKDEVEPRRLFQP